MNDVCYWYIKVILELRPLLAEILKGDTSWSESVISGINYHSNSYFKIGLIKRYIIISGSNVSVWLNVYTGTPYNCFCYFELLLPFWREFHSWIFLIFTDFYLFSYNISCCSEATPASCDPPSMQRCFDGGNNPDIWLFDSV